MLNLDIGKYIITELPFTNMLIFKVTINFCHSTFKENLIHMKARHYSNMEEQVYF